MGLGWSSTAEVHPGASWKCGYCGNKVAGNVGYTRDRGHDDGKMIFICPHCENPTAFIPNSFGVLEQVPGSAIGNEVQFLPEDIEKLYGEVRRCIQYTAYTAATLLMRKLIMHLSVEQGAKENQNFVQYIDYLDENNWIPPNGKSWVDSIRKKGNEATHEVVFVSESDVIQLFGFVEMLLKFMYEFPNRIKTS